MLDRARWWASSASRPTRRAGTDRDWEEFAAALRDSGIELRENIAARGAFATDAGGTAYGLPHGVVIARSAAQIAALLKAAQQYRVPVTVRGGGLTTEGESVAFGGVLLDMTGMSRVLDVDADALTVRTEAGIFWHSLAEELRRHGMDYLSAPLNLTSSVGGTLGVGGIDVNSPRLGCSADQALAMQVVTPTGEIVECSDTQNAELFQRVILGYGQFGVITEATLKIRRYTPLRMHYFYYASLRTAIEDLQLLDRNDASDYSGILTIMDCAVNLLVAFDSDEREAAFLANWRSRLRGYGELGFALRMLRALCAAPVEAAGSVVSAPAQARAVSRVPPLRIHARRHDARPHRGVLARGVEILGQQADGDSRPRDVGGKIRRGGRARQRGLPQIFSALHAVLRRHQAAPGAQAALRNVLHPARCRRLGLRLRVRADDRTTACTAATICSRSRTRSTTSASIWAPAITASAA